jgi:hypothetical protein
MNDEDESEHRMPLIPVPESADHRHNWHEAIEALVLFARALKDRHWKKLEGALGYCFQVYGAMYSKLLEDMFCVDVGGFLAKIWKLYTCWRRGIPLLFVVRRSGKTVNSWKVSIQPSL